LIRFGRICCCRKLTSPVALKTLPMEDNEENIKTEQTV
jgi:hypothetical protein